MVTMRGAPADGRAWGEEDQGDCSLRVVRGGGWNDGPREQRSAFRDWSAPDVDLSYFGFRLARDL